MSRRWAGDWTKGELNALAALFVLFFLFIGFMSLLASRGGSLARESITVIPPGLNVVMAPHGVYVAGPFNLSGQYEMVCVATSNWTGFSLYALTPPEYKLLTENHTLGGSLLAWNVSQLELYGQVTFAPGTYYVALYNPNNVTVSVTFTDPCLLRP